MDKKRLTDRLEKLWSSKDGSVRKNESVDWIGSIYLSAAQKQDRKGSGEEKPTKKDNRMQPKGTAQMAVEMLGAAIRK